MRNATQNASVAPLAPKAALIDMSRTSPSTREIIVMLLNESSPRNMLGDFMRLLSPSIERRKRPGKPGAARSLTAAGAKFTARRWQNPGIAGARGSARRHGRRPATPASN
ncbi:hypothetical protein GCM10009126_03610 [Rhodanobacter caeni]|uniref:Uncharacterized protein n=1 Tax=Rhodanobacter caeni TaxID=657654 RepID=A0ABN0U7J4_9GAMM